MVLKVGGKVYDTWRRIQVTRSLESLAHAFTLEVADTDLACPQAGEACVLEHDGEPIVTGYIDDVEAFYTVRQTGVILVGRSRAGDLVDCSAVFRGGQWRNRALCDIAKDLCGPFGLGVEAESEQGGPFQSFSIQESETVFECLERAARLRGVLLTSKCGGDLVVCRAGSKKTTTKLKYGENILAGSRRSSFRERFKEYRVKSQTTGSNDWFGSDAASPQAVEKDEAVGRHRPLVVLAEAATSGQELKKRATWERNVRAGRSQRLAYSVLGWSHDGGLWEPNLLVKVEDERLGIDAELLVVTAALQRDERGTRTDLELVAPEGFEVLSLPEKKEQGLW